MSAGSPPSASSGQQHRAVRPHRSIFLRVAWQSALLTTFTVVALGSLSFLIARSLLSGRVLTQVTDMATIREDVVEKALRDDRERATLVAARADIGRLMSDESALRRLRDEIDAPQSVVLGLTIFDALGDATLSVGSRCAPPFTSVTTSLVRPFIDAKRGWIANDVFAPLTAADGARSGSLCIRYDVSNLLTTIFAGESLGAGGRVAIGLQQGGEVFVIQHSGPLGDIRRYSIGSITDKYVRSLPLSRAVQNEEGAILARDERGRQVFAAYRYLPALGWGMTIELPEEEALSGIDSLGIAFLGIGAALLAFALMLAAALARSVTRPILDLADKMSILRPGHWLFRRSVRTGDEVEMLDQVAADLTARLKSTYDNLEEQVAERTRELRAQYALDRAILETIEQGVVTTDAGGTITDANPAILRMIRREESEVVGKDARLLLKFFHGKKPCPAVAHPVSTVLRSRAAYRSHPSLHMGVERVDGTIFPIALSISPLLQGGALQGSVIVFQDMTEERQIDYMKSEFISLASHQLRTPLSSIRWYLELFSEEGKNSLTEPQHSYLTEIEHASSRMANLIEALLHVARLEGGAMGANMQPVELTGMVRHMGGEWASIAREKGVQCAVSLPSQPVHVKTDPVLLQVVLQNLLSNAVKYSPAKGGIILSLAAEDGKAFISVSDSGIGIPAGEQGRLFEKFFRARNVRSLDTDGTGLGLYMSRTIMEKLKGTLGFHSEEGKGTTFTVGLSLESGPISQQQLENADTK